MSARDAELVSPLAALRRRWVVALVLTVAGAVAGAAVGAALPTSYTAEARVAVGSTDLSALSIPGYALGSQQLASNIARYVGQSGAKAAVQASLGGAADSVSALDASPVTSSNIIRVEATAGEAATARAAADAAAQYLVSQSSVVNGGGSTEELLAAYTDLSQKVAAQMAVRDAAKAALEALPAGSPTIPAATATYVSTSAAYDTLAVQQSAASSAYKNASSDAAETYKLVVVTPGADSYDTARSALERYALVGLAAGLLLALLVTTLLGRRAARGRHTPVARSEDEPAELDRTQSR